MPAGRSQRRRPAAMSSAGSASPTGTTRSRSAPSAAPHSLPPASSAFTTATSDAPPHFGLGKGRAGQAVGQGRPGSRAGRLAGSPFVLLVLLSRARLQQRFLRRRTAAQSLAGQAGQARAPGQGTTFLYPCPPACSGRSLRCSCGANRGSQAGCSSGQGNRQRLVLRLRA
jgi:hypothetical protein